MKLGWVHDSTDYGHLVLLFGVGLIGRCILQSLARNFVAEFEDVPCDWTDGNAREHQLAALRRRIAGGQRRPIGIVDVIWSAGKAGFGANADELLREDAPFDDILQLAADLAECLPSASHRFHMMSSAGGLFEGQRLVDRNSEPRPVRPYGRAKLSQELRARCLPAGISCSIYRPSSVYGHNRRRGRSGLIAALINGAKTHQTSHIYGNINTLRDYVMAGDIGAFVAAQVSGSHKPGEFLLASGKPAAIGEVIHIVERAVARRLYVRFEHLASNADHMSFIPAALPEKWVPTNLETGIRLTASQMLGRTHAD
jgi:nucleoside-diphosphate-sugar epimerase